MVQTTLPHKLAALLLVAALAGAVLFGLCTLVYAQSDAPTDAGAETASTAGAPKPPSQPARTPPATEPAPGTAPDTKPSPPEPAEPPPTPAEDASPGGGDEEKEATAPAEDGTAPPVDAGDADGRAGPSAGSATPVTSTEPGAEATDPGATDTPAEDATPDAAPDDATDEGAKPPEPASAPKPKPAASTSSSRRSSRPPSRAAASRARRERTSERAAASISKPLEKLQKEKDAVEKMSAEDQAILVDQIAQAAIVELSAMRDELASAQLDSENLQTLLDQLERDRREIPPAVSAGRIPTFGARERWNRLAETIEDLEVSLDEAFSARINLLSKMPELKADLKTAQTLLGDTDSGLAPSLRQLLEDAADKLQERIDMCDELSEAYRQEVAVAVEAYDVASRYSAELSEAMVEGRSRGLEARVPGRLSLHTARALAEDIGKLPAVAPQLATTYCDQGNCPQTILATSLRILAVVLLIWLAVHGWKQTPGWIYTIAETYLGNTDADDN